MMQNILKATEVLSTFKRANSGSPGVVFPLEFEVAQWLNHAPAFNVSEDLQAERIGGLILNCSIVGVPWVHSSKGLYSTLIVTERALAPFDSEKYRIAVCERVRCSGEEPGPWMDIGSPNIFHIKKFLQSNPDFDRKRISAFISGNSEYDEHVASLKKASEHRKFLEARKDMLLSLRSSDFDRYFEVLCEIAGGEARLRSMLYPENIFSNMQERIPKLGEEFKENFREVYQKSVKPYMSYFIENLFQDESDSSLWTICTGEVAGPCAGSGYATRLQETQSGFVRLSRTQTWVA